MRTTVEIIGVYPVKASEPVHLVEMLIRNSKRAFDVGKITQKVPGQPISNWQVPYDEKILNATGTKVVVDPFFEGDKPELRLVLQREIAYYETLDFAKGSDFARFDRNSAHNSDQTNPSKSRSNESLVVILGDIRLAFFFHYLDLSKPLKTPFGDVTLPAESKKPRRLSAMNYEAP